RHGRADPWRINRLRRWLVEGDCDQFIEAQQVAARRVVPVGLCHRLAEASTDRIAYPLRRYEQNEARLPDHVRHEVGRCDIDTARLVRSSAAGVVLGLEV